MASLMLLPDELKLQIIANIEFDMDNTLVKLRQVHPWFRASIKLDYWFRRKLFKAERDSTSLLSKELSALWSCDLVCYYCHKVLPKGAFSDRQAAGGIGSYSLADLRVTYADLAAKYADAISRGHFEEQRFMYETKTTSFDNETLSMRLLEPCPGLNALPTRHAEKDHFTLEDAKNMLKNMRLPELPIDLPRFQEIPMETPISDG
ncbi:MAG: hypothetical protein Q9221_001801 [Calogaya cf. arnoldii]